MLSILGCLQVFAMYLMKITKSSLHAPVADQDSVNHQVSYHIIYSLHDYISVSIHHDYNNMISACGMYSYAFCHGK